MRRSAWTIGAALLAALSLGVAACGGSSSDEQRGQARTPTPTRPRRPDDGQGRRQADGPLGRRRRLTSTAVGPTTRWATSSATRRRSRCTPTSPTTATTMVPGPRRGSAGGLRGRQDRHGQDQAGREVLAAVQTTRSRPADVKYAIERGFFNSVANGFTQSYYGDLEGAKVGVKPGTKITGITTPDDYTIVLKFKRAVGGVMAAGALAYPRDGAGARGVRREVHDKATVDLRREPARHRPVHGRERRRGQGDRLRPGQAHPPGPQPELGQDAWTSSPRTSTRSTTSRATTIRASPRAASSTARA